jgi:hypothetical protein
MRKADERPKGCEPTMRKILVLAMLACLLQACGPASPTPALTNLPAATANEPSDGNGELGFGTVRGRVIDAATGAPIAGAQVTCLHNSNSTDIDHQCNQITTTDQNGEFLFADIFFTTEDVITVHVQAAGYGSVNTLRGFLSKPGIDLGDVQLSSTSAQPAITAQPATASRAPLIGSCPMFPADNYWNAAIDALPIHSDSDAWIDNIGRGEIFHMDFGSGTWDGGPIGIPFNIVSGSTVDQYTPEFYYPDESDPGPYPISDDPNIEWGRDHHILTVDTDTCTLYEIYDASFDGSNWSGGSGAIWDLNSNALRPDTWTSGDVAGLPILPGLVRYDEILAGEINHALRFTAEESAGYIWPARHPISEFQNGIPPMGARFRLKADYDISRFPAEMQVILQAMKTYGIVLADHGSNWYVSGAPDERWDNDMLHLLDVLTGNDFEAVDTSILMVDENSAEINR